MKTFVHAVCLYLAVLQSLVKLLHPNLRKFDRHLLRELRQLTPTSRSTVKLWHAMP